MRTMTASIARRVFAGWQCLSGQRRARKQSASLTLVALPEHFWKLQARKISRPTGLNLSQAASAVARQRGFDVRPGPFDAMAWPEHSFDVVTALEVLEHVRDIRSTMADLARIAKTDGMLVFFVPNVSDFIIDKYGDAALDFNKSYDHTFYFNRQFLTRMCDEVFGEGSLTLITKDVEQWEQTVSSALGFVRLSPADKSPRPTPPRCSSR